MKSTSVRGLLLSDSRDVWHRRIKWAAVPVLAVYAMYAVRNIGHRFLSASQADKTFTSVAADSGLQMKLLQPFPRWALTAHGLGAVALLAMTLAQKEVVRLMSQDHARYVGVHRRLGYAALAALLIMDMAGYYMGRFSAFPHFSTFSIGFAMPFAVWLVGIWWSASARWLRLHAFLSNMLLKGCIATPLSRLGGALLQSAGWDQARGYYQGIFGVAAVIVVWQAVDIASFAHEIKHDHEASKSD
jgi:uncharacterized membrane protein